MEWQAAWEDPFRAFLQAFEELIGDRRSKLTLAETIRGIIAAGSLVCQRIAACSPVLSRARKMGQRVIRFAKGESTKRSRLDDVHLTAKLREQGVAHLSEAESSELWIVLDGSGFCKPYAQSMPALSQVRDADGKLVPGYSTLTAVGMTPGRRAVLYQRVFSSQEERFQSESAEVQRALQTVHQAVAGLASRMAITWILDRGFDDVADDLGTGGAPGLSHRRARPAGRVSGSAAALAIGEDRPGARAYALVGAGASGDGSTPGAAKAPQTATGGSGNRGGTAAVAV
ncbi:MAG: hypothetical protein QXP27_05810 [Candidatus Methanomethyliaceae archaeon]